MRDSNGEWTVDDEVAVAREDAVNDVLLLCANLRGEDIAAVSAGDLGLYGLDTPSASLTLGLTGESGIQKTLLFGNKPNADTVYAMVRGQDVRFVLPVEVVDLLMRELVSTPPFTGEE